MSKKYEVKAAVRRRFEFIEFSLLWERSIGRKRLKDQFEMSLQQATKDLNLYSEICPENMRYDPRMKTYVPSSNFRPAFINGEASEYLLQLEMQLLGYREADETWITTPVNADAVKIKTRDVRRVALNAILKAIHTQTSVRVKYVSLNSGATPDRHLMPHALATDGHRWHMRAYDVDKDRHSDFVLSRIESVMPCEMEIEKVPKDNSWHTKVPLILESDPRLGKDQKAALEAEYGMKNGCLALRVRQSMLFYYLRNYGFNPKPIGENRMRNESSLNLYVRNIEEVEECLQRR
jgi:predicted DNA-binding transcriptional regulator YafY